MLQILSDRHVPLFDGSYQAAVLIVMRIARGQAAALLRLLILLLVGLLLVFINMMVLTGGFEIGGPIIGSVLFTSFFAAQFSR